LLLNANEVVSSDRLLEALWGEHPPDSGAKALQVRVSQLRKALGPAGSLVLTRAPGYLLALEGEQLDLSRFERLVAEGEEADPPLAAVRLREALALWRGPALADLAFESFAQPAIARLEELRLVTLEKRIDADLALDRHAEVVAELEALAAEHPLRERVRAQLMLALYRCGRQADALAVYQSARRELVEELGIEPSRSLRELEQSILRQDPGLDPAAPTPHPLVDHATDIWPSPVASRYNLPAQVSSFVGRERELRDLRGLLSHTRALTLVGAGGVGKTRLALELAELVLEGWGDGVWFVDLAPLADPALVASKVASVLAVPEAPGRSASESVIDALRSRELMVILDNCEHVIDSAALLVRELVTGCPRVAIVSTSREPLRIAGEQVYRVPSLSVPGPDGSEPERMADSEAVRLFVDRARQQRPDFALDLDNCHAVARLCRRLDGIPLAIELAAARIRAMPVGEIEKRLGQRFALLTGGDRHALPRQRTLEALIDWSYSLLNPSEQELLERPSVFAGGFDLEAAELLAGHGQNGSVLDEVVALADKSLIQWDASNHRYRLLESVRDYAAAKLLARGNAVGDAARTAHRDYYLRLAEAAAPHLIGHGQIEWLDRLHVEVDNLRAAIAASLQDPDPTPGLLFARALRYFWITREPTAEGAIAVCAALDRPAAQARTPQRGGALIAAALLALSVAPDTSAAAARAEEALAIARALGDEHLRVEALCALATVNVYQGNEDELLAIADEGLQAARKLGDPQLTSWLLGQRATAQSLSYDERVRTYEECLCLEREAGNQVMYLRNLNQLGNLEMEAGQIGAARVRFAEALRVARTIGDRRGLSLYTCNLGFAAYLAGDDPEAQAMFDESLQAARRNGDSLTAAHAQLGLALLASRRGDAQAAASLHGSADAIHEKLGTVTVGVEARLREIDIARTRDALGDTAFKTAYARHTRCNKHQGPRRATPPPHHDRAAPATALPHPKREDQIRL